MAKSVRQSQAPMPYTGTMRADNAVVRTSSKAGVVAPVTVMPLHRGDSATGRLIFDMELAEMPKPLENAVIGRVQAWFVPRPALPHFEGLDEYTHSFQGKNITRLGAASRTPPSLFDTVGTGAIAAAEASEFFKSLGISLLAGQAINTDYIDAYNLVQNFRLASYSSKATRYDYYQENAVTSLELKPAFWPVNRMHSIVPDYENALVKGALELDITAGQIPVSGLAIKSTGGTALGAADTIAETGDTSQATTGDYALWEGTDANFFVKTDQTGDYIPEIYAEMTSQTITTTLADIDQARTTQAMAKARTAMAGNNFSGFNNDDVLVAELMQGYVVPEELFNRPWLLDSKTVVFGMQERHATDAANLDDSVSVGRAQAALSINIPKQMYGGVMLATVEVMPERLYERQMDDYLYCTTRDDLPDAERDVQRTSPVDIVFNGRIDTHHTVPFGTFGYEPMNDKWKREFTRLGGEFRQLVPGTPSTVARTAIWQVDYVDPAYTTDHYLCEHPFPQDVFSVPANDIVNISCVQQITIAGITQFGDELVEDNGEFAATQGVA